MVDLPVPEGPSKWSVTASTTWWFLTLAPSVRPWSFCLDSSHLFLQYQILVVRTAKDPGLPLNIFHIWIGLRKLDSQNMKSKSYQHPSSTKSTWPCSAEGGQSRETNSNSFLDKKYYFLSNLFFLLSKAPIKRSWQTLSGINFGSIEDLVTTSLI